MTTPGGRTSWTVCDPTGLPLAEVDDYVLALAARRRSINTQKAYCQHLAALFTFLDARGLTWDSVQFADLTEFMTVFEAGLWPLERTRGAGGRGSATVSAAAAAVKGFYDFQRYEHGVAPEGLTLSMEVRRRAQHSAQHFLRNVESAGDTIEVNRLSHGRKKRSPEPRIIGFEDDFRKMLDACETYRDRLMLSGLYDLGLRVGGLVGMKHGDLNVLRKEVTIVRREDNPNGALSKRQGQFTVHAQETRFLALYRDYYLTELVPAGIESDFVFVNLKPPVGRPMSGTSAYQQVRAIAARAGLGHVTPHVLRHTHATALAKAQWTSAEIAKRLGQTSASSADVYIHLADDHIEQRLAETQHLVWPTPRTASDEAPSP